MIRRHLLLAAVAALLPVAAMADTGKLRMFGCVVNGQAETFAFHETAGKPRLYGAPQAIVTSERGTFSVMDGSTLMQIEGSDLLVIDDGEQRRGTCAEVTGLFEKIYLEKLVQAAAGEGPDAQLGASVIGRMETLMRSNERLRRANDVLTNELAQAAEDQKQKDNAARQMTDRCNANASNVVMMVNKTLDARKQDGLTKEETSRVERQIRMLEKFCM